MKSVMIKAGLTLVMLLSIARVQAVTWEDKVKVINLQSIGLESDAGKVVVGQLQELSAKLEAEIKQLMAEIKKIDDEQQKVRADAAKKAPAAGAQAQADTEKKIRDLEYKKGELQAKAQRVMQDARNDLQMEEARLTQPLFADLVAVIAQWAKEKDIYLVFDESSGRVIYKKEGLDATADVLKLANKKNEQKMAVAKAKPAKTPAATPAPSTKVA